MKVLVDGWALYSGSQFSGLGGYTRGLLSALGRVEGIDLEALVVPGTPLPPGCGRATVRRWAPPRLAALEHEYRLRADLRRHPSDLYHCAALDPPRRVGRAWVQTFQDAIPLTVDDPWFEPQRDRWRRRMARMAGADAVLTPSSSSADDAARLLAVDPARIHVVPHGVDERFRPPPAGPTVEDPYLLVVSEYMPHKGLGIAFEVIARVRDAGLPHRLRYVGRVHPALRPRFDAELAEARAPERVDERGHVAFDDLVRAYQGAAVVLVPSRYEGFGFPAVEAMACGAPVVAFDNSSLREVVGEGGMLVPDGDTSTMAEAVIELLRSPSERERLGAAGTRWAARYRWDSAATATVAVYRSIL